MSFEFLELPREIRDQIYECIFGGHVLMIDEGCGLITRMKSHGPSEGAQLVLDIPGADIEAGSYVKEHALSRADWQVISDVSCAKPGSYVDELVSTEHSLDTSFLEVNRQIRSEALRILYHNVFCFTYAYELHCFTRALTDDQSKHIRRVRLLFTLNPTDDEFFALQATSCFLNRVLVPSRSHALDLFILLDLRRIDNPASHGVKWEPMLWQKVRELREHMLHFQIHFLAPPGHTS